MAMALAERKRRQRARQYEAAAMERRERETAHAALLHFWWRARQERSPHGRNPCSRRYRTGACLVGFGGGGSTL